MGDFPNSENYYKTAISLPMFPTLTENEQSYVIKTVKNCVMNNIGSKLALGSANFGLNYGLANNSGKISANKLADILSAADGAGVEIIDAAQAYGDSEARLGALCGEYGFKIVAKIDADLENDYLGSNISNVVKQSCKRLNQTRLHALLLHRPKFF